MSSRRKGSPLALRSLVGCCLEMKWESEKLSRQLASHICTEEIGQCLLWRQLLSSLHGETSCWSGFHHWDRMTYSYSRRDQRAWTRIAVSNFNWLFAVKLNFCLFRYFHNELRFGKEKASWHQVSWFQHDHRWWGTLLEVSRRVEKQELDTDLPSF